jgi:hypothetical protein
MATSAKKVRAPLTEADVLAQIQASEALPSNREPAAEAITFEPQTRRFTLRLVGGTVVDFSADVLWELQGATAEQLAQAQLVPSGSTLTWPDLDADISVAGLVLDLLASPEWRRVLRRSVARELAATRSPARAAAARANGKRGGRPRKSQG